MSSFKGVDSYGKLKLQFDVVLFNELEDKYFEIQAIERILNLTIEPISPHVTTNNYI